MAGERSNSWNIEYNFILFFGRILDGHANILGYDRFRDILFTIRRSKGGDVSAVIVNEYILGMDAYYRIRAEFPEATWIVNLANWNCYTIDAKEAAFRDDIALFIPSELSGALWSPRPSRYHRRDKDGQSISYAAGRG